MPNKRLLAVSLLPALAFAADLPPGWSVNPSGCASLDDAVLHAGQPSFRIERQPFDRDEFSGIARTFPAPPAVQKIELRGWLRTENVDGFAALWLREDSAAHQVLAIDSLQRRNIGGTRDWAEYTISVPAKPDTGQILLGFLIHGTGRAWVSDLRLFADGQLIWEMQKSAKAPIELDHEFDGGSKIAFTQLTNIQVQNLALLGKVWGFLKYHHPLIAAGKRHWDYDLFRIMPAILAAPDLAAADAALAKWIAGLGEIEECRTCATLKETDIQLRSEIAWIGSAALGPDLSRLLRAAYRNRPADGSQFYVSQTPVKNPAFGHELPYANLRLPDPGFQLLALYRFWNIIEYWYPYRNLIGEDWDGVLEEFIPKIALAQTPGEYQLALMALIARVHDTHANLWSSLDVRPPVGACHIPVAVRFVEGQAVATSPAPGLDRGDIVERLDGTPIPELIRQWEPYYAASNEPTILRDIGRYVTRGECGDTSLQIRRNGKTLDVTVQRVPGRIPDGFATHDTPGDTFRLLSDDVAYLKLSSVKSAECASYIERAAHTKGLIVDIRNYPSQFVVFTLGNLLVDRPTPFVISTSADLANPGAFHFETPDVLTPDRPHYAGKVVILVDEITQSQAEYTAMAFRSSPQAWVIGSTTAGADGNVSPIPLPGGLRTMISGLGIFYPDKRATQRAGIVPDQEVKPTIADIREGRDEVLEAAIRRILGPDVPQPEIEKLARAGRN